MHWHPQQRKGWIGLSVTWCCIREPWCVGLGSIPGKNEILFIVLQTFWCGGGQTRKERILDIVASQILYKQRAPDGKVSSLTILGFPEVAFKFLCTFSGIPRLHQQCRIDLFSSNSKPQVDLLGTTSSFRQQHGGLPKFLFRADFNDSISLAGVPISLG